MNKKGMDISLNFIILAVLALIALIVIALFFTGGLTNLFKQQEAVGEISGDKIALAKTKCELYCTTNNEDSWKANVFDESDPESAFYQKSCADLISGSDPVITLNKDFVNGECVNT
ncbi:hypothetical protein J4223_04260 [Candidatus Woesearchaeota archaeon]|nr:hypothetical protein [Candidatus Woesearchaeota archaeon]